MFFKRKEKYPLGVKYNKGDFVNFRYRDELYFGYIFMAYVGEDKKITYTIQLGGQCPSFLYDSGQSTRYASGQGAVSKS